MDFLLLHQTLLSPDALKAEEKGLDAQFDVMSDSGKKRQLCFVIALDFFACGKETTQLAKVKIKRLGAQTTAIIL